MYIYVYVAYTYRYIYIYSVSEGDTAPLSSHDEPRAAILHQLCTYGLVSNLSLHIYP